MVSAKVYVLAYTLIHYGMDMAEAFISYARVSTPAQGRSGLGLEAQRETIARFVEQAGGVLLEEYVEVETGKITDRPVLNAALAACRKSKATLIVAKLDRLSRNVAHVASLLDGGVDFRAADAPFANRFVIHILAAVSEYEREQISSRTKAALAAAKARGIVLGSHGEKLAIANKAAADAHAETLRGHIQYAISSGADTLKDIAASLNFAGIRTREGAAWGPASTQRVMMRLGLRTSAMVQATPKAIAV